MEGLKHLMENLLTSMQTILIVEDDAMLRSALSDELKREGFKTIESTDGIEALNLALKEHPDLILLDLFLPKLNGIEVLKKLRNDSWGKGVKVLILTNQDPNDEMLQTILDQKVAYYLIKANVELKAIVEMVNETLKTANQPSS